MNAYYCDRCGDIAKGNPHPITGYDGRRWELCGKCIVSFADWTTNKVIHVNKVETGSEVGPCKKSSFLHELSPTCEDWQAYGKVHLGLVKR